MQIGRIGIILVCALLSAACGAAGVAALAAIVSSFADAVPDEFGIAAAPAVQWEITKVVSERTGAVSYDTLTVRVTFVQTASIPAAGAAPGSTHIAGFVEFDTDLNAATGDAPLTSAFCPAPGAIGVEFLIDLFSRNANGTYDVFNSIGTDVGDATPSISGTVLSLAVPLSALGGDDGMTHLDMVLGSGAEPTDCAPDAGGAVITRVPTKTQWRSPTR